MSQKRMDKYQLEELLNMNVAKITQLIGEASKKGNWTLSATLYGEYAIETPKEQYCPKGQDKIRHPHYEFSVSLKKDALKELLSKNPKWPKSICKQLLMGISHEIDIGTWY
jgi:hypothetical protein